MRSRGWGSKVLGMIAVFGAMTQTLSYSQDVTFESEESLFVLAPHSKGVQPESFRGAITLMWIPQPLQKYCLGKTYEQCAAIDYCNRTTDKAVAMCQSLPAPVRHLPAYPPDMRPRRVLSVVLMRMTLDHGFGALQTFFNGAPPGSFDHISASSRVRAIVKLTRTAQDDSLQVLEVLAVPGS